MVTLRVRSVMWFVTGIALAIVLVWSFSAWRASAAPGPNESTFVPVTPVRILDTRDPTNVGLTGPFVSAISQDLKVTGLVPTTSGSQIVVPDGSVGVVLNVTAVLPTANGFLSIRPADAAGSPTTSNLNFSAGQIVPNAVTVAVPTAGPETGMIEITYNAFDVAGPTADVLIDVVGYNTRAGLVDLDTRLAALEAARPIARSAREGDVVPDPANPAVLTSVTITVPVAGTLVINGSTYIFSGGSGGTFTCNLSVGAGNTSGSPGLEDTDRHAVVAAGQSGLCATNGSLAVTPGTFVINIVGDTPGTGDLDDTTLDVIFIPDGQITATATDTGALAEDQK